MISLEINGVDRTSNVKFGTLKKDDNLNERKDSLKFSIRSYTGNEYVPELGQEIELFDGADVIFGGVIVRVSEELEGDKVIVFNVECTDYSQYLDRLLVVERYTNTTVDAIIADLITNYAPDFTGVNVNCPLVVTSVTFDRVTVTEALGKLSKLTNYSWYVDYDMDIHFFERSDESAPFGLTDTAGNHIFDSLKIERDLTQLRNRVYVRGGEIEGEERTELLSGTGDKLTFPLGNKFSGLPTVEVGGVPQDVGVDYLDQEADFDVFWNFTEKYIRFKDTTVPASGTDNIEVTGLPLFNLIMRVEDSASIAQYGVYEFSKTDKTIKSREEAKQYAIAQLQAYAENIAEGTFSTYTSGLRSGQIINVSSVMRDIDEDFLIQKVSFTQVSPTVYRWDVTLATLRTMGIIDFLIGLLQSGEDIAGENSEEVLEKVLFETETITLEEVVVISKVHNPVSETVTLGESNSAQKNHGTQFVAGPYNPSSHADTKRVFILNGSRLG